MSAYQKPNVGISKTKCRHIKNQMSAYQKPNVGISKTKCRKIVTKIKHLHSVFSPVTVLTVLTVLTVFNLILTNTIEKPIFC
jgi:hypothetical protein